jgi:hypothetical protein
MDELSGYLRRAEAALAEAEAAPLSVRRALLCAVLIDDLGERAFTAWTPDAGRVFGAQDALAFRRALRRRCPELGLIADLCGMSTNAPRLVAKAIPIAADALAALPTEDFMVSLYNEGNVPRVMLVARDGERPAHEVLARALGWWREQVRQSAVSKRPS